ncbi:hypothetical protein TPA0598_04_04040 [Streptomyces lydicamycinicus]|uniref:Uncharacterized protein n=1 Tax=Streptomyces lydicamycinicus TaxID=1546107 RepID=A0A0P4R6J7_9ACTN|nr:hypothetical protein TPA0598_04_04040 [Streptomyces lydicamycinicus]
MTGAGAAAVGEPARLRWTDRPGGGERTGASAAAGLRARHTRHLRPSDTIRLTGRRNLVAPYGGVQA